MKSTWSVLFVSLLLICSGSPAVAIEFQGGILGNLFGCCKAEEEPACECPAEPETEPVNCGCPEVEVESAPVCCEPVIEALAVECCGETVVYESVEGAAIEAATPVETIISEEIISEGVIESTPDTAPETAAEPSASIRVSQPGARLVVVPSSPARIVTTSRIVTMPQPLPRGVQLTPAPKTIRIVRFAPAPTPVVRMAPPPMRTTRTVYYVPR